MTRRSVTAPKDGEQEALRIAVFRNVVQPPLSETFIKAHEERLRGVVVILNFEKGYPAVGRRRILLRHSLHRVVRKVARELLRIDLSVDFTHAFDVALRRSEANVSLAEYGTTGVRVCEACQRAHVPLVVHFHGVDASDRRILAQNRAGYRRIFAQSSAVIAVSRAMKAKLCAIGCPEEKLIYNPYGVDCSRFSGANPSSAEAQFLAVGRMVEKKSPHLTLLAFALAHQQCPQTRLRFIGDGSLLGFCRELAGELGISDVVTFLGAQPNDVVHRELVQARAFVQHSVTAASGDSEGTPVAILEAGAIGLPVVSTRHAGIQDVVIPGETGLLVDERDFIGMARCMVALARDPGLAGELGRNAASRVRQHYTIEQSIDRLQRILKAAALHMPMNEVRQAIEAELPPRGSSSLPSSPTSAVPPQDVFSAESAHAVLDALQRVSSREPFRALAASVRLSSGIH